IDAERPRAPTLPAVQTIIPQLLLAALKAGITSRGELVLELLDAASRIDELQFAGVEGVANIADIDLQLLASAAGRELIAAAAGDLGFEIFGMDAVFHDRLGHFLGSLKVYRASQAATSELVARLEFPRSDGDYRPINLRKKSLATGSMPRESMTWLPKPSW